MTRRGSKIPGARRKGFRRPPLRVVLRRRRGDGRNEAKISCTVVVPREGPSLVRTSSQVGKRVEGEEAFIGEDLFPNPN